MSYSHMAYRHQMANQIIHINLVFTTPNHCKSHGKAHKSTGGPSQLYYLLIRYANWLAQFIHAYLKGLSGGEDVWANRALLLKMLKLVKEKYRDWLYINLGEEGQCLAYTSPSGYNFKQFILTQAICPFKIKTQCVIL